MLICPAGTNVWTSIGPEGGGIYTLAIDPAAPASLYAGTYKGGVCKSTNGGGDWQAVSTGLVNTGVLSLAIDPATPTSLYAGTEGGGVFTIQQIPALTINYSNGAPGSFFTITGSNFPPDNTAPISINGNILGTVPTDSSGGLIFLLETNLATEEGFYRVTASVNPGATIYYTLESKMIYARKQEAAQ